MDVRRWLLLNELPQPEELRETVMHIPCSQFRTHSVLKLFAAGHRTRFHLTDAEGQPTEALRVMVSLMDGVTLGRGTEMPDNVKKAFGKDDPTLFHLFDQTWYLQGLADRLKAGMSAAGYGREWIWDFLPGLDSARVAYREEGKKRKRVCYIAGCPTNWRLTDAVYEGLWRWNYDHIDDSTIWRRPAKCPDAYGILERHPAIRAAAGEGDGERPPQAGGAAATAQLSAAIGGT